MGDEEPSKTRLLSIILFRNKTRFALIGKPGIYVFAVPNNSRIILSQNQR